MNELSKILKEEERLEKKIIEKKEEIRKEIEDKRKELKNKLDKEICFSREERAKILEEKESKIKEIEFLFSQKTKKEIEALEERRKNNQQKAVKYIIDKLYA